MGHVKYNELFSYISNHATDAKTLVSIACITTVGYFSLPIVVDIYELSKTDTFYKACCSAVIGRGLEYYMDFMRNFNWLKCKTIGCVQSSANEINTTTPLYVIQNQDMCIEIMSDHVPELHLWNISDETLKWVNTSGKNRKNTIRYLIYSTNTDTTKALTGSAFNSCTSFEPFNDDLGAHMYIDNAPNAPTTFLGKYIDRKSNNPPFIFSDEKLIKAHFDELQVIKQPMNIVGASVLVKGTNNPVDLPILENVDYMYRVTCDVTSFNNEGNNEGKSEDKNEGKIIITIPNSYGSPTHLHQMLIELQNTQESEQNWQDLSETLTALHTLKSNGFSYEINLLNMKLINDKKVYINQKLE